MADLLAAARRFVELFNRDFAQEPLDFSAELRAMFVAEPVVVPMRAALEGIEYRGSDALDQASAAFSESWTRLQLDLDELRVLSDELVFGRASLSGTGRGTGAEASVRLFWLIEFEGNRIAAVRSFLSESEALAMAAS